MCTCTTVSRQRKECVAIKHQILHGIRIFLHTVPAFDSQQQWSLLFLFSSTIHTAGALFFLLLFLACSLFILVPSRCWCFALRFPGFSFFVLVPSHCWCFALRFRGCSFFVLVPSHGCRLLFFSFFPFFQDAAVWSIKQFNGSQEYLMRAHFGLPSISAEDAREWKAPIQVLGEQTSRHHILPFENCLPEENDTICRLCLCLRLCLYLSLSVCVCFLSLLGLQSLSQPEITL